MAERPSAGAMRAAQAIKDHPEDLFTSSMDQVDLLAVAEIIDQHSGAAELARCLEWHMKTGACSCEHCKARAALARYYGESVKHASDTTVAR